MGALIPFRKALRLVTCAPVLQFLLAGASSSSAAAAADGNNADPFKVLDPQNWMNPDDMTWDDFTPPPGTNWSDPSRTGSVRNFHIALVTVDYADRPFVVTLPPNSDVYGNPQPGFEPVERADAPRYYHDQLNRPGDSNLGHTLHEYWMGDSLGRFGVDLSAFGPYEMPQQSWQYGIDNGFNSGACPSGETCNRDIRTDALGAWRADVGNDTADSFELVFILSAGQDESSTWQEFGEMRFQTPEDVPAEFGPPVGNGTNYAPTRYVEWTSWAAASNIWPNAGAGSSTQAESSGMSTYAHELSHLLGIGDNYNNPYGNPLRRAYAGPFSMLDRGSFNGPGGPHTRWQIPAIQGGSMGSLHTVRDKSQLGLISNSSVLELSRESLADSGIAVATLTARAVDPGETGLMGIRVAMGTDLSPACDINTDVLCDGGGYNNYHVEVVDRMGADSFVPDSGVMISKTKDVDRQPFQWVIDANPQDIELVDFYRPGDGSAAMITMGDYRQLADALFHAGTRSGSQYEFTDEANRLHFYVIDIHRNNGVLAYTVAVRSLDFGNTTTSTTYAVALDNGEVTGGGDPTGAGVTCSFELTNTGSPAPGSTPSAYLDSDVFRLAVEVDNAGWRVELPNALAAAQFGNSTVVDVAVAAAADTAAGTAVVKLTATSESDSSARASAECEIAV